MNNDYRSTSINSLWSDALIDELSKSDVQTVCVTPGSRNTPLVIALSNHTDLQSISIMDERNAGFFGVGNGTINEQPIALISTSGSATAEFHPAVMEASNANVPLLVITADRPPELHQSGANQTVEQHQLYGDAVRWFRQTPEPQLKSRKFRALRTNIQRAVARTMNPSPGPVHLNVPFRKPLEPKKRTSDTIKQFIDSNPLAANGRNNQPFIELHSSRNEPKQGSRNHVLKLLEESQRPLVFVGPLMGNDRGQLDSVKQFYNNHDLPLLADPLSNFRSDNTVDTYEWILPELPTDEIDEPDLILRLGSAPNASNQLMNYLERSSARQISITEDTHWHESEFLSELRVESDIDLLFEELNKNGGVSSNWRDWYKTWNRIDNRVSNEIHTHLRDSELLLEPAVLLEVLETLPRGSTTYIGNSTPIRDLIQFEFGNNSSTTFVGNRGTSGIDGQISTIAGLAYQCNEPVTGIVGDVGFLHDMNSLRIFERQDLSATIVVINNKGGGIFERLPVNEFDPPFSSLVKTSHEITFQEIADQFDVNYRQINSLESLQQSLKATNEKNNGSHLLEVITDSKRNQEFRRSVRNQVQSLLDA